MARKPFVVAFVLLGVAGISGIVTKAFRPREYQRVVSPDGRHVAVAKYRTYESWLSAFPGQSGDKSGWVELWSLEGAKLGKFDLGMVWQIDDLRWDADRVYLAGGEEIRR